MYSAYITKLKNIRKHPNADRLNLAECFGNTVVVSKDYDEETLYIYFPVDGQLSEEYATINNLIRKKDENGVNIGGFLEPDKRNIRAIKLRGEKSDGLVMPLDSVEYTGVDMSLLQSEGIVIHMLNGHEICCKYVPRRNPGRSGGNGNRTRKNKVNIAPLFAEHADTQQLQYNLSAFRPGDQIEISLKMHGTSQRTDSPLPLSIFYNSTEILGKEFNEMVMKVANSYERMDYLIYRVKPYNPNGRFQTEAESNKLADDLVDFLDFYEIDFKPISGSVEGYDKIVEEILKALK